MTSTQDGQATADLKPTLAALVAKHAKRLDAALAAIAGRGYWSAYPESPSPRVYGEGTAEAGKAAFEAHLGKPFPLGQRGADGWVGGEASPYGLDLGITYQHLGADALVAAATEALPGWRAAGPRARAAVCLEIIDRINARSFEIAHAVMHTSGQAFVMSFQAGGAHAQDRALEAVAYGYAEQTRHADTAVWEKPQGKRPALRMEKTFTPVPRGIALVVGCTTFPTWNAYPGLFASLATGNAVIVKPHPGAVLPLAITVFVAREVLGEFGFDPNLVLLAAEAPGEGLAAVLAVRPEIKIVDFTGSTAFGDWLEEHARQARVYTEKAGGNMVLIESTSDYAGMLANLAFSLVLYSGQMCTTPQDLLVPAAGIETDQGHKDVAELAAARRSSCSARSSTTGCSAGWTRPPRGPPAPGGSRCPAGPSGTRGSRRPGCGPLWWCTLPPMRRRSPASVSGRSPTWCPRRARRPPWPCSARSPAPTAR